MSDKRTLAGWIAAVAARFEAAGLHYGHGTDNPVDEAAWLVLHVAGESLAGDVTSGSKSVSAGVASEIERLAELRCTSGKPLAYLTGTAFFAGLEFEVNEDVLVPRSPMAELILDGFRPWVQPESLCRVLDLCTGSGCIGIASAMYLPGTRVDLADIDDAALSVARANVLRHGLEGRVRLFQSDLFASVPGERYELITANPPYVPQASVAGLPAEYRAEPELGLASGRDGLDAPLSILLDAAGYLCEDGVLVCEVGESERRLDDLLPDVPFTWLEFAHGGSGVFVLTRDELVKAAPRVAEVIGKRNDVT
jgi:ribosomal protein L3 glutamine methyltransferase